MTRTVLEQHMRQNVWDNCGDGELLPGMEDSERAKGQLRANRRNAIMSVMRGSAVRAGESPRWPGDTGKRLRMEEKPFWSEAETNWQQTKFEEIDEAYELAKADL